MHLARYTRNHQGSTVGVFFAFVLAVATFFGASSLVSPTAQAAECAPYTTNKPCSQNVPVNDLSNGIPAAYKNFLFSTNQKFTESQITTDSNWKILDATDMGSGIYTVSVPGAKSTLSGVLRTYIPLADGAKMTVSHVGKTLVNGKSKWVNATFTISDINAAAIDLTAPDQDQVDGSLQFAASEFYDEAGAPVDSSLLRDGMTVKTTFSLDDGGSLPAGFKGISGFTDLDGMNPNGSSIEDPSGVTTNEGWEALAGIDALYKNADAKLAEYGQDGLGGTNGENTNGAYFAFTFTGDTFTARYSN
ncbi:MAG: hypothetical protein LKI93_02255 [Bifidobacteriaceae bacterium]|jgi:hypothetical protein|nr:hypothetical protein [Bifidobacteriaceae bacterium]MCI1914325.1 hypothetical protein [Bifidobacteriaceae bacterium]